MSRLAPLLPRRKRVASMDDISPVVSRVLWLRLMPLLQGRASQAFSFLSAFAFASGFASPRTSEGQRRPGGRPAGMRAVLHRDRDVPYEKSPRRHRTHGPLIQKEAFFFGYLSFVAYDK